MSWPEVYFALLFGMAMLAFFFRCKGAKDDRRKEGRDLGKG
jgi:hypothetical protein